MVLGARRACWREARREGSRGEVGARGMRMGAVGSGAMVGLEALGYGGGVGGRPCMAGWRVGLGRWAECCEADNER